MTSDQIRAQFIDFFVQKHGHTFVPSSPVVPLDDPTLLFTNAGMNQFKPIFLGQETRSYRRAANTQKCIRAGGKHNDLDDVGRSRRHHTFFEMLGNWSFGDYFKRGAIEMAWELLTVVWKIPPNRLHVSCYEGNEAAGIPRDTEAADLWKQVAGVADDHIHYFGKDNFWEMGETGPCGPCTEIYVDRRPDEEVAADKSSRRRAPVNGDDPRVMEIWNLVFIQYNRDASGKLTTLPAQHVDTGMGLERICQVLQDKQDNYATDLWTPIFSRIADISGCKYTGQFPKTNAADPVAEAANPQLRHDIAFRVVADHIRCLTFALTDGAVPSNEGRGYVLRRILRRAVRFGRQQLGLGDAFLHKLVPVVVESMSGAFPELNKNPNRVVELVKEEEISFGRTLDRGIRLFEQAVKTARRQFEMARIIPYGAPSVPTESYSEEDLRHARKYPRSKFSMPVISDEVAFRLHDTYGFPIDLTQIMAEEQALAVDVIGYQKLMDRAKELSRSGGKSADSLVKNLSPQALSELAQSGAKATDDHAKYSYDPCEGRIVAIWNGEQLDLSHNFHAEGRELAVILDQTNFYAEMGGQVGDAGEIRGGGNAVFDVDATRVVGGFVLHIGHVRMGTFHVGDAVTAVVMGGRYETEKNHTATHLANWALRETLGDEVQQKGSLVDPVKLRFDFSHSHSLEGGQVEAVTSLVNQAIHRNLPVCEGVAPQTKAFNINGLRAVFGEKYPPMVRVISIGAPVDHLLSRPDDPQWRQFSIEFCGGTHVSYTGEIGAFVVISEESVSKGVRRIVSLTGEAAKAAIEAGQQVDRLIGQARTASDSEIAPRISDLQKAIGAVNLPLLVKRRAQTAVAELQVRQKAFEKHNRPAESKLDAAAIATELLAKASSLAGGKIIVSEIPGATDDQLRSAMDSLKKRAVSFGILLASRDDSKVTFVAAVSDDLIAKGLKAGDWVREAAKATGGGGGGRPQMAQAGGKDPAKLPDALRAAMSIAEKALAVK